tara:strand:- start:4963 stop:6951 length:1989 start_codon:yes stop_codon:yes gene_type:complete
MNTRTTIGGFCLAMAATLPSLPSSAADDKPDDGPGAVRVIKEKPADATSLQRLGKAVLASKPLTYWRMHGKEEAVAIDASPNGNNGTYEKGASPYSPDGKAGNLNGGRMRAGLELPANTYSVELWFWNETPHHARLVTGYMFSRGPDGDKSAVGDHLGIGGTHGAAGRLFLFNGNQRNQTIEGSTQLVPRTWNHVVMVRQKNEVAVYLNGHTEPEIQGRLAVTYKPDSAQIFVGGRSDNFANLVGRMDEVALYDRALTPKEAKAHFDAAGVTQVVGPKQSAAVRVAKDGETEHFWYRLAPVDPYIDSQRDNKAFAFRKGVILLSEDNGKTWPHTKAFPNAKNITFSCIMKNGNVLFATRTKLYLSTDNLKTHKQITVKDQKGRDYLPHTPRDPNQPGWYFHPLDGVHTWDVDGREMLVWGNYCNVIGGSVPVNIYYSTDQGRTVKIACSFGRNPRYTDGGTPLGDPDNPVICRHIHSVAYNPKENAFYACTGDHDLNAKHECHWLRGLYDRDKDTWIWKVLESTDSNTRYKSGGINFVDGNVYWAADANGRKPHDRGIFRCNPADLADPSKHTMLFDPKYPVALMIIEDGVILAGHIALESPFRTGIMFSPDMGKTWAQYDLKEFGKRTAVRFHRKNSDGWFRVDLRTGWVTPNEVLFIKPK